ncbi:hypothetical protein [Oceanicaulis sp.]|uniref:hypothetical protein n=1 Tax=Oceanicaulis sp. TaxID=1924941 RepID=UPI003D2E6DD4
MKTPYKKPAFQTSRSNRTSSRDASPAQEEEPAVCNTIRRNIGDDSAQIRTYELEISRRREQIRRLQDDIAMLELRRQQLRAAEADVPRLPGPDLPVQARGRLGALLRILKTLGQIHDAVFLADAINRAVAVRQAEQEIDRNINSAERDIERIRGELRQYQGLLDDRVDWMKRHFKAFKDNGCEGSAFNSYRFTPSSRTRRLLT